MFESIRLIIIFTRMLAHTIIYVYSTPLRYVFLALLMSHTRVGLLLYNDFSSLNFIRIFFFPKKNTIRICFF